MTIYNLIFGPYQLRSNFWRMYGNQFAKIIGLDIAKQVFSPEVKRLLASKAWKKSLRSNCSNFREKVGAKSITKKMIGKMVPGGISATNYF